MSRNLYVMLKELLPDPALMVGTVTSTFTGFVIVDLPGGGSMQVRGQATVGQDVYFRNGVVESVAPSLTLEVIDI